MFIEVSCDFMEIGRGLGAGGSAQGVYERGLEFSRDGRGVSQLKEDWLAFLEMGVVGRRALSMIGHAREGLGSSGRSWGE